MEGKDLESWIKQLHKTIMFTDGASKGNLGAAGGERFSLTQMDKWKQNSPGGLKRKQIILLRR